MYKDVNCDIYVSGKFRYESLLYYFSILIVLYLNLHVNFRMIFQDIEQDVTKIKKSLKKLGGNYICVTFLLILYNLVNLFQSLEINCIPIIFDQFISFLSRVMGDALILILYTVCSICANPLYIKIVTISLLGHLLQIQIQTLMGKIFVIFAMEYPKGELGFAYTSRSVAHDESCLPY
ncbi:hypothetical protein ACJX0J_021209 [Zea mays]